MARFDQQVMSLFGRVDHKLQLLGRLVELFVRIENDPIEQFDGRSARPNFVLKGVPTAASLRDCGQASDGKQVRSDAAGGQNGRLPSSRPGDDLIEKLIPRRADEAVLDDGPIAIG